jgi:glycerol-1-phosphatase
VRGLLDPQLVPRRDGDAWVCGGWRVTGDLARTGDGDDLDALRALCAAAWAAGGVDRRAAAAAVKGLRL